MSVTFDEPLTEEEKQNVKDILQQLELMQSVFAAYCETVKNARVQALQQGLEKSLNAFRDKFKRSQTRSNYQRLIEFQESVFKMAIDNGIGFSFPDPESGTVNLFTLPKGETFNPLQELQQMVQHKLQADEIGKDSIEILKNEAEKTSKDKFPKLSKGLKVIGFIIITPVVIAGAVTGISGAVAAGITAITPFGWAGMAALAGFAVVVAWKGGGKKLFNWVRSRGDVQQIEQALKDGIEGVKTIHRGVTQARQMVNDIRGTATRGIGDVKRQAEGVRGRATREIGDARNRAARGIQDMRTQATDRLTGAQRQAGLARHSLTERGRSAKRHVDDSLSRGRDRLQREAGRARDHLEDHARRARTEVQRRGDQLVEQGHRTARTVGGAARRQVSERTDKARHHVSAARDRVRSEAFETEEQLRDSISSATEQVEHESERAHSHLADRRRSMTSHFDQLAEDGEGYLENEDNDTGYDDLDEELDDGLDEDGRDQRPDR